MIRYCLTPIFGELIRDYDTSDVKDYERELSQLAWPGLDEQRWSATLTEQTQTIRVTSGCTSVMHHDLGPRVTVTVGCDHASSVQSSNEGSMEACQGRYSIELL